MNRQARTEAVLLETQVHAFEVALELVEFAPTQQAAVDSLKRTIQTLRKEGITK